MSDIVISPRGEQLVQLMQRLRDCLGVYEDRNDPADAEGDRVAEEAAQIGRDLVGEIEKLEIGEDRLGQNIRNLFECLGFGEEGASISLRAGEDRDSLMRPT